jgi:hypothetical protein
MQQDARNAVGARDEAIGADESVGQWARSELEEMDARFVAALERERRPRRQR